MSRRRERTRKRKRKVCLKCTGYPSFKKTPYKARFIAGSRTSTTTKLTVMLTVKLLWKDQVLTVNGFSTTSLDVLRTLEEKRLTLNKVSTWDFSTLYTSLPHAKLKLQLHDLLERVFITRGKSFIATNSYHTFWTNDRKSTKYTYFTCRELCLAVDFLIENILFRNSVFRQVIGIPMGTNSAPLLADLLLHTFQVRFHT